MSERRISHCRKCNVHDMVSRMVYGHPESCPFRECTCKGCILVEKSREKSRKYQQRLHERRRASAAVGNPTETAPPLGSGLTVGVTRPQPGASDAQRGGGVADAAAPAADAMNRVTAEADGAVRRPRPEQRPSEREMPRPSAPPRNNAHHTEDEPDVQQPVKQPVKQTLLHRLLQQPKLEQRDVQEPAQPPAEDPTLDLAMQKLCIKCSAAVATEAELQDHVDVVHMELVPLLRVNHIFELMKEAERQRSLCDASEMPEVKGA